MQLVSLRALNSSLPFSVHMVAVTFYWSPVFALLILQQTPVHGQCSQLLLHGSALAALHSSHFVPTNTGHLSSICRASKNMLFVCMHLVSFAYLRM